MLKARTHLRELISNKWPDLLIIALCASLILLHHLLLWLQLDR